MSENVISVRGLGKKYRLGATLSPNTLRDHIVEGVINLFSRRGRVESPEDFWALRNVDLDISRGEVVGVIGRNGAGKTTLLKILSEITEPSEGEVRLRGRVSSLLEVGTGFHPELSGRENVYLNGAILGMTRVEIKRKFDEIVEFAGVSKFIDTPVKRYSSGMYVRLAFAVAAHLESEILLVDEVLAVGDAEFQKKCIDKMGDVVKGGRTILFVSHNMAAIESLCSRSILLRDGSLLCTGETNEVIEKYISKDNTSSCDVDLKEHSGRHSGMTAVAKRFRILDSNSRVTKSIPVGKEINFEIDIEPEAPLRDVKIGIHIYNWIGERVLTHHTAYQHKGLINIDGRATLCCHAHECNLIPGQYSILLGIMAGGEMIDRVDSAASFDVVPSDIFGTGKLPDRKEGVFISSAEWKVRQ